MREAIFDKYFATEKWENDLEKRTSEYKRISDYSSIPFQDLEKLPISIFLLLKKDSWIHSMQQSEESIEVLKNIQRLSQKKADKDIKRKSSR